MHLPSEVAAAAVASTLAFAPVSVTLVGILRRRTGPVRCAYRMLTAGAALTTLTSVVGMAVARALKVTWAPPSAPPTTQSLVLAIVLVVGGGASTILLLAGLLRLPGVSAPGGVLLRHLLDAILMAGAISFGAWVLMAEPTRILGYLTPRSCEVALAGSTFTAVALGMVVVVMLRMPPRGYEVLAGAARPLPRRSVARIAGATALISTASMGLAVGTRCGWEPVVVAAAFALPLGILVLGWAVSAADRAGARQARPPAPADQAPATGADHDGADLDVDPDVSPYDREGLLGLTTVAFLPVGLISLIMVYQVLRGGPVGAFPVGAGIVVGFTLVARQYLALLDARRATDRLAERKAHFRVLAHTDPLTTLPNRRGLLRTLYDSVRGGPPCVLLLLDLDGFKNVNDMRGHDVGDAVLAEVGRRLRVNLRPGDLAARLGGDEFAVLMWGRPGDAQQVAERLLAVLSRPYEAPSGAVFLSASIGLAGCATADDIPSLLRNADLALRYAKQRGKSRVEQYDADYEHRLVRRTTLEHELYGAIERDELHLAYQPVVGLPSVRTVGAEALLRWHHPRLGPVEPGEFIAVAEESGMIVRLGGFVLHQACHQLSRWLSSGHDVWVSVNVSPYELHFPDYVRQVAEVLRVHRVPPQRLVLEVTEQVAAPDRDELIRRLTALRATGVRIALDDFGAGYNSLGQLRNLPVDILKIDHSLVAELDPARGPSAKPLVDVVAEMGHRLGLEVIAEGVTAREQCELVVKSGCRFAQGEMFGLPVPAEHLEARLAVAYPRALDSPARTAPPSTSGRPSSTVACPGPHRPGGAAKTTPAQYVGPVDSGHEMRQA